MASAPQQGASERSAPSRRIRWATQRVKGQQAANKRRSIFNRHLSRRGREEKKRESDGSYPAYPGQEKDVEEDGEEGQGDFKQPISRRVFFNIPLPDSERDEDGKPRQQYARNKIRTAKYTPLSFIPKNLYFQFHNIANVYFAIIIILGIFSIFGVTNPGLAAVPLIVILTITAIKDGIEDWRRTVLDNELNNAPVHRLVDWTNVNTSEEKVGMWRRIKKACTRAVFFVWRLFKRTKQLKKGRHAADQKLEATPADQEQDGRRVSIVSERLDAENDDDMEMTPVQSPGVRSDGASHYSDAVQQLDVPKDSTGAGQGITPAPKKFYGSLLNPHKEMTEKPRFQKDYWKNVQVGDFVRLYNEEQVPADIVVLSTSESDGACYIETKNLDGETNLKVRTALHSGRKVRRARDCEATEFTLETEPPHPNLYAYSAVVRWQQYDSRNPDAPPTEMAEPVGINNLLLRGCALRNTEWILGVVVFTGDETKIMQNSGITPRKRAQISKDLNWNVSYNFIILFIMCLTAGFVEGTTWAKANTSITFYEFGSYGGSGAVNGLITFFAAVILFQNLVPISLYITLEIIRTIQAFFIFSDTFMYYEKLDYPCTPKSWNISDDLGQIEYIFSDKTGTLTQNVMEFKKCTINGVPYGEAYTEALAGMQKRQGINVEEEGANARRQIAHDRTTMIELIRKMHNNPYFHDDELTFVAPDFIDDLDGQKSPEQKEACSRFMLALALCHTVITERTPGDPPTIEFKAQSPDEAALVATARDVGFSVMGRENDDIIVNVLGKEQTFHVLNTLEFNSTRKRMSAIVRMPDGKIILFCKGADSVIYSRLKRGEQFELRKSTAEHLEMFAREGLRTLCIAQRELSEEEYQEWSIEHDAAAEAVQNRDEKLDEVADSIEREFTLLGGTAIEDRLQDGVPDAIQLLAQAGIKLWVLTGDKVETAINIGFSCNLLDNNMDLIILKVEDESVEQAEQELDKHLAVFGKTGSNEELKAAQLNHEAPDPTHALIIDGETLKVVLDDNLKQKFLLLCKECRSVLCCRVSPAQKAAVVHMVKSGLDVMTLSIGDGANDVAMIQEAHVGVGIAGEEGRQAVMSSDYAIGQFRFLTRLMLVHGRWSYRRMAETIANFFYKNIVWTFVLFWYQIYTNFDCSYAFDYSYILLYNLAFTSLPVILMGVLDQDVSDKVSLAVPQLYRRGIERKEWTQKKFWLYMLDGLYQSVVAYYFTYLNFKPANFLTESGQGIGDYKRLGVYVANPVVIIVNTYLLLNVYRWDWFFVLITGISVLLIFFWTGVYTAFTDGFTFYEAAPEVYGNLSFWSNLLVTVILCLLPRFTIKSMQKMYFPRDVDIVREQIRQGKFDYLKEVAPDNVSPAPEKVTMDSASSTEGSKPSKSGQATDVADDMKPIYPPSVAQTATTRNTRTANGSDGTDYTGHPDRESLERAFPYVGGKTEHGRPADLTTTMNPAVTTGDELDTPSPAPASASRPKLSQDRPRPSYERAGTSFDRFRSSMDRVRPSFEASHDFTSAAYLTRVESAHSGRMHAPTSSRSHDITKVLRSPQ